MSLVSMSDQFQGLPMESLIGGPLTAAVNAQVMLANATATFINTVGFDPPTRDADNNLVPGKLRTVDFNWSAPVENDRYNPDAPNDDGNPRYLTRHNNLSVPFLAMVPVPNLQVDSINITFDMEVKSSETHKDESAQEFGFDASVTGRIGPFDISVQVHGKASSHQENTRSSDNSAKYHVDVTATNHGMPEGLMRIFDIIDKSIAPVSVDGGKHALPGDLTEASTEHAAITAAADKRRTDESKANGSSKTPAETAAGKK
jgi:hypothetical protein